MGCAGVNRTLTPIHHHTHPPPGFVKRTIDVWRHGSIYASLVHRIDLEVAQVLSQEKRESATETMDVSAASPPPPPPPPPRPRP